MAVVPVNGPTLALVGNLGSAPVVLVTMVATVVLLSVRAYARTWGVAMRRTATVLLDGSSLAMFLFFIVLVIVRFKTTS